MRNKKGISTMIEYVMLIVIAISMTGVVYLWLRGYVPSSNDVECKDGASIYISKAECSKQNDGKYTLLLTIKNTGRYQLRGFYIRGAENAEDKLPSIDLSVFLKGNVKNDREVFFEKITPSKGNTNIFSPNNVSEITFENIDKGIKKIEITPTRVEEINDKYLLATCKNAIVTEYISCP